jgi:hypothetical protein
MVEPQQGQLVLVKLKQLRILVEALVFLSLLLIVQINIDIEIWLKFSKD